MPHVSDFGSQFTLSGGRSYVGGIWASWIIYVPANSKWCTFLLIFIYILIVDTN